MNILLDTCTYIWFRTEPEKLSKKAVEIITDKENTFFLSAISIWEINIKVKIGKLQIKGKLEKLTNIHGIADSIMPVGFSMEDAEQITIMSLSHKDPFDLMLICQAITNSFAILTPDPYIKKYRIKTMW